MDEQDDLQQGRTTSSTIQHSAILYEIATQVVVLIYWLRTHLRTIAVEVEIHLHITPSSIHQIASRQGPYI